MRKDVTVVRWSQVSGSYYRLAKSAFILVLGEDYLMRTT